MSRPRSVALAALVFLTAWLTSAAATDLRRPLILVATPTLDGALYSASVLVVAPAAHVAGDDAWHAALLLIAYVGTCEARIEIYAQCFCLLTEPATQLPKTYDVIAVVDEAGGQQEIGKPRRARFR